jgi:sugar phosphate isomerase/epimerase
MAVSRRDMLKLGAGAAALWTVGTTTQTLFAETAKKIPIGLQLYSLRDICGKDVPGTLAAVAEMGYEAVEFAGYYNRSAKDLRKILDKNGLKCCGTHTGIETLQGDQLKKTVEFNKTLGNTFLIVPWLSHEHFASVEATKETAKMFTELAEKVEPEGMRVGYHSHAQDFAKIDGKNTWDLLFENAGPRVISQLDTGNCMDGGGDPLAELKKFPGRGLTMHVKEHGGKEGAAIGEGVMKWKEIFAAAETIAGVQWYVLEQETYDTTPLDSMKRCIKNAKKILGRS